MIKSLLILKDELQNNPENLDYTDNQTAVVTLNAKNRTFNRPLSSAELLAWAGQNGRFYYVKQAAEQQKDRDGTAITNIDLTCACMTALKLIDRDGTYFDLNRPEHVAVMDALVMGNILTADDQTSIYALASHTGSRAEELGIVEIDDLVFLGHVTQARNLIEE